MTAATLRRPRPALAPAAWYAPAMPRWLAHTIVAVTLALLLAAAFASSDYSWNWAGVWQYRWLLVRGFVTTVGLSLAALVGSIAVGLTPRRTARATAPLSRPWPADRLGRVRAGP